MTDKPPAAFVPLRSVARGPATADEALAEIRAIYFKTTRQTIEHDFAHAIELLKSLPDEAARERAHVYMEGLAEMQREWLKPRGDRPAAARRTRAKKKGPPRPP